MKQLIILFIALNGSFALSQSEFLDGTDVKSETKIEDSKTFNARASHWLTTFGFEYTSYELLPEGDFGFAGNKKSFKKENQSYVGARLGFGGEIYLGAGFITRTMLDGYFHGTLFDQVLNGGDEAEDVDFAFTKKNGQIYGLDITQSLGWMFDMKTKNPFMDEWSYLTIEPFVEAGIGMGRAYSRISYRYDTQPAPTGDYERYKFRMTDEIMNTRLAGGVNFTGAKGFFFQLKAAMNTYVVSERKIKGMSHNNGPFKDTEKNVKLDPIMVYTLGGGYKF